MTDLDPIANAHELWQLVDAKLWRLVDAVRATINRDGTVQADEKLAELRRIADEAYGEENQ